MTSALDIRSQSQTPWALAPAPAAQTTGAVPSSLTAPVVDIVLPVYNEEAELRRNVRRPAGAMSQLRHSQPRR